MIVGFGNDLCDIRRIERALSRYDKRFTHRLFTDVERKNQISGLDARPHTLSVLPQKRRAQKRWERASATAFSGKIWV